MNNLPKKDVQAHKSALTELIRKAVLQYKPQTKREMESIVNIVIQKYEESHQK